jgi:small-conductance mechanosensitive channel
MRAFLFSILLIPIGCFSQQDVEIENPSQSVEKIAVNPVTQDSEIQKRLEDILNVTGWFADVSVQVREGVVFLSGNAKTDESKKWAGHLARNTQNVVAVVNKIEVIEPSFGDFSVITKILYRHWRGLIRAIPSILMGSIILAISWGLARLGAMVTRGILLRKFHKSLLQDVVAKSVGILIFLLGIYLIFEMADLTGAALTIVSGTGLLGIILGLAFRDITENFLASILLSIHHPFRNGDLVEIAGLIGYVQGLTMRMTLLMSLDGNHIQIPNSIVYKSNIRNYSSNPNRREEFSLGIGYDDTISKAQEIALGVLEKHEAVLKNPEPWVLVDSLGKATINLRIYFWLDGSQHSWLKVRSSVIRLIKRAFQVEGISMPDEAREVIFPKGISIQTQEAEQSKDISSTKVAPKEPASAVTDGESGLRSEAKDIQSQAKQARSPEEGRNLLNSTDPKSKS